jgi:hypothetical protein
VTALFYARLLFLAVLMVLAAALVGLAFRERK